MTHLVPFLPASADYPNHLAAPEPERPQLAPSSWLLLALVLACLVPRAAMALRITSVCPDGVLYIHLAQAIEAGDFHAAFREMSLNIYPLVLAGLHRMGLGWELAASLWGITISSLVVLPLWGWARRQFDDRVALVACLLYAVHPKMIEWSPEVMRDPTFWFLFMLAIYWLWRAVTEVRQGYFIAAGAAITTASLTRIEGLFLLSPLVLWTFWRLLALRTGRQKLLIGAVLCVVAFPSLLALVNFGWLYSHSGWTAMRLSPLARVQPWLQSVLGHATIQSGDDLDPPMTAGRMIWIFIPTMTRGLSPVFALLMLGGLWGWRRLWARRDHQPLFYTAVLIMCGIWVQLWFDKQICPRYALPIVLMASVFAALGLLGLMARLLRIAQWKGWGERRQAAIVVAAAAIVAVLSLTDAMTGNWKYFDTRQMAADVGRWVQEEFPARPMLVGPVGITPIVSYYAQGSPYQMFRWEASDASIMDIVEQSKARVVLLRPTKQLTPERCAMLVDRLKSAGWEAIDRSELPSSCDDVCVLVRIERAAHAGRNPSQAY
jgi:hypothetical protein